MSKNLEIKARLSSDRGAIRIARRLHAHAQGILHQRDIYYKISPGRLKLRIINHRSAELIFYKRPDIKGGRYSTYMVLPVSHAKLTDEFCTAAFGRKGVVEKKRRLFLYKNSRIHIDDVRGLGTFIEFEVQVKYGLRQARALLDELSAEFCIAPATMLAPSYSDLLLRRKKVSKYRGMAH